MANRPPIPAEIARRVLVEAGHRCAIHTCKNPDIDLHHIIPWEKCKEHTYENLIALCPNCHRRVHSGEIDRRSLLMYKAQLVQIATDPDAGAKSQQIKKRESKDSLGVGWEKQELNEESKIGRKYSVQIEYPVFTPKTGELEQINTLLKAEALRSLIAQRAESARSEAPVDAWWAETGDAYASSFEVMVQTADFISVRQSIYSYFAGAAHPNHGSRGVNYALDPLMQIHLEDMFRDPRQALNAISDYCIKFIELENHDSEPNHWVREGAAPDWKNFQNFCLQLGGLCILFNPYEVGCYAQGERRVFLADHFLGPMLRPDTKLKKIWWWPDV